MLPAKRLENFTLHRAKMNFHCPFVDLTPEKYVTHDKSRMPAARAGTACVPGWHECPTGTTRNAKYAITALNGPEKPAAAAAALVTR